MFDSPIDVDIQIRIHNLAKQLVSKSNSSPNRAEVKEIQSLIMQLQWCSDDIDAELDDA